ncbi:hypothetical protein GCM10009741_02830 [Kribbella lupini]|uniref:Lipoprotein n=1 Tax=Kribbella lupini TaxID=291602 RepID=A0ABN2A1J9_9ACTN
MRRQVMAVTAAVVVALSLTACNGGSSGSATPPPFTPSSVPPASSTTPSEHPGSDGAVEAYRQFIAATDAMGRSGGADVTGLRKYSSGTMLAAELNQAATFKGRKWRSVGQQKVVRAKVLTTGTPGPDGAVNEVVVEACVDSSQAITTGPDGKPVRPANAPTQLVDQMKMVRVAGAWTANYPHSRKPGKC